MQASDYMPIPLHSVNLKNLTPRKPLKKQVTIEGNKITIKFKTNENRQLLTLMMKKQYKD